MTLTKGDRPKSMPFGTGMATTCYDSIFGNEPSASFNLTSLYLHSEPLGRYCEVHAIETARVRWRQWRSVHCISITVGHKGSKLELNLYTAAASRRHTSTPMFPDCPSGISFAAQTEQKLCTDRLYPVASLVF